MVYIRNIILISLAVILLLYIKSRLIYDSVNLHYKITKKHRIVVSLSTLPSRINKVHQTIRSIENQTMKPDWIYLNVPSYSKREKTKYVIPDDLTQYVNHASDDYGPLTKFLPTLQIENDPETMIICVDDDKIYDPNLIQHLYYCSSHLEFKSCVSISGWDYINFFNIIGIPLQIPFFNNYFKRVMILQCYQGVIYKRGNLKPELLLELYNRCESCFTVDDILISFWLRMQGIPIHSISGNITNTDIDTADESKLSHFNIRNNTWTKCINTLGAYL